MNFRAFSDELQKIATMTATPSHWEGDSGVGEVVEMMLGRKPMKIIEKVAGHLRSGRRPISALKLLKKEGEMGKKSVMSKLATTKKFLAGMAVGAGSMHVLRRANEDRKIGREVRKQQGM